MSSIYRACTYNRDRGSARRTSWWRVIWAQMRRNTLTRIEQRRIRHELGIVYDPQMWFRRGLGRHFSDSEIDRFLPKSLRKVVAYYDSKTETIVEITPLR